MRTAIVSNLLNLKYILSHVSINSLGLCICPGYLLDFLSLRTVYPTMVGKIFQIYALQITGNAFFAHHPRQNFPSGSYHQPPDIGKLLISPKVAFFRKSVFPQQKGGERKLCDTWVLCLIPENKQRNMVPYVNI